MTSLNRLAILVLAATMLAGCVSADQRNAGASPFHRGAYVGTAGGVNGL